MKGLSAALVILGAVSIGLTAALVHRPPVAPSSPAAPRLDEPVAEEHFAGSAETLTPAELLQARKRNKAEMDAWHKEQDQLERAIERRIEIARARPRSVRLPAWLKWGRCLLVVQGRTRISGRCAYGIEKDGSLGIEGPRQIYGGIDYPKAGSMADERSNDYWASVFRREDGTWTGYGNDDIKAVHAEGSGFGTLRRDGACWVNPIARICQWKT